MKQEGYRGGRLQRRTVTEEEGYKGGRLHRRKVTKEEGVRVEVVMRVKWD